MDKKQDFIEKNIKNISFAVGIDVSSTEMKDYLKSIIDAGIDDLINAGVNEDVIYSSPLSLPTLIIYCLDNQTMTGGEFKMSPNYINYVQKLKFKKPSTEVKTDEG